MDEMIQAELKQGIGLCKTSEASLSAQFGVVLVDDVALPDLSNNET